ncbi:MAG: hypothetical protein ABH858_07040 [Candidatus Omnitrophota bacterium]
MLLYRLLWFFRVASFSFYVLSVFGVMLIQYLAGPKIVEWTMRVKYVERREYPLVV